ncbi:MAG TPA: HD domain-containing protein, partial [Oscillospiraceae bacterium]|nr:HD domain-containing protein [Oscillospiraceae bacterium]
ELFIILLTGHKSLAPPIKTIRELDIQGYYEKSDRFDQLELLVESCVKSIKQMRTIRNYQEGLAQVVAAMPRIYHLQPPENIAGEIVSSAQTLLDCGRVFVCLDRTCVMLAEDPGRPPSLYYLQESSPGVCPFGEDEIKEALQLLKTERMLQKKNVVCTALFDEKHAVVGLLGAQPDGEPEPYCMQLFEVFARQGAAALRNALLHEEVSEKNQALTTAYARLRDSYLEFIQALRLMVDAKDIYTRGHSDRVSYFAHRIAQALGRSADYCERVRVAGLFHDIGKLGVSDSILLKESRLTEEEYDCIKRHSENGMRILSGISLFRDIAPIVKDHHEHYDGTGYPAGLKGEEIREEARIIGVADAFDAMTSNRRYRTSLGFNQAVEQLRCGRDKQFDGKIVDVFLAILKDYDDICKEIAWTYSAQQTESLS